MEFKKYESLENTYRQKTINKIIDSGLSGGLWQVSEKIHGANFSFWYDGVTVKVASRTQFVDGTFFNCQSVINRYEDTVKQIFEGLGGLEDDILVICGELHGQGVQREVEYSKEKEFSAFDMKLNGEYLDLEDVFDVMDNHGMPHAPLIGYYSFEDALKVSNDFKSLLTPEYHEGDNFSEGVVIKPIQCKYMNNGKRVVLKNKSAAFNENKSSRTPKVPLPPLSEDSTRLLLQLTTYITENRLNNVLSKIGQITTKDFGKLQGLFVKDAFEEFEDDLYINLKQVVDTEWKMFNNAVSKEAGALIRSDFLNIIDRSGGR